MDATAERENFPTVALDGKPRATPDEREFRRFYDETALRLRCYLLRMTGDPDLADDIMQTTYLRFWTHPPAWGNDRQVRAYLYRIATRLVYDHSRKNRRLAHLFERIRSNSKEQIPDQRALEEDTIARSLLELPVRDRMLLWLVYYEGCSYDDVAAILDMKRKNVGVVMHRSRKKFAVILRRHGLGD